MNRKSNSTVDSWGPPTVTRKHQGANNQRNNRWFGGIGLFSVEQDVG